MVVEQAEETGGEFGPAPEARSRWGSSPYFYQETAAPPTRRRCRRRSIPTAYLTRVSGCKSTRCASAHLEETAQLLGESPQPDQAGSDHVSLFVSICQEKWRFEPGRRPAASPS